MKPQFKAVLTLGVIIAITGIGHAADKVTRDQVLSGIDKEISEVTSSNLDNDSRDALRDALRAYRDAVVRDDRERMAAARAEVKSVYDGAGVDAKSEAGKRLANRQQELNRIATKYQDTAVVGASAPTTAEGKEYLKRYNSAVEYLRGSSDPRAKQALERLESPSSMSIDDLRAKTQALEAQVKRTTIAAPTTITERDRMLSSLAEMEKRANRGVMMSEDARQSQKEAQAAIDQARQQLQYSVHNELTGKSDVVEAPVDDSARMAFQAAKRKADLQSSVVERDAMVEAPGARKLSAADLLTEVHRLQTEMEKAKANDKTWLGYGHAFTGSYYTSKSDLKNLEEKIRNGDFNDNPRAGLAAIEEVDRKINSVKRTLGESNPTQTEAAWLAKMKAERDELKKPDLKSIPEASALARQYDSLINNPPADPADRDAKTNDLHAQLKDIPVSGWQKKAFDEYFGKMIRDSDKALAKANREGDDFAQNSGIYSKSHEKAIDRDYVSTKRCESGGFLQELSKIQNSDVKICVPVTKMEQANVVLEGFSGSCDGTATAKSGKKAETGVAVALCDPRLGLVTKTGGPVCVPSKSATVAACMDRAIGLGKDKKGDQMNADVIQKLLKGDANRASFLQAYRNWKVMCTKAIKGTADVKDQARESESTCKSTLSRMETMAKIVGLDSKLYKIAYDTNDYDTVASSAAPKAKRGQR